MMGRRLLTSRPLRATLFVLLTIIKCDEAVVVDESFCRVAGLNVAQQVPDVVPSISHLDVWAGVSSFSDAFNKQSHVTVKSRAWIEYAPAAVALLSAMLQAALWCLDFFSYAWRGWKFKHDLVVTSWPQLLPIQCLWQAAAAERPEIMPRTGDGQISGAFWSHGARYRKCTQLCG